MPLRMSGCQFLNGETDAAILVFYVDGDVRLCRNGRCWGCFLKYADIKLINIEMSLV